VSESSPSFHHWSLGALVWLHATSLLILLAIVEELSTEELIDLVLYGAVFSSHESRNESIFEAANKPTNMPQYPHMQTF